MNFSTLVTQEIENGREREEERIYSCYEANAAKIQK